MAVSAPVPGQRSGYSISPRDVLMGPNAQFVGGVFDSANAYDGANTSYETRLRPGLVLAQVTATRKWVPCKRTTANGAGSATATLVVVDARTFKVGDTLMVGANAGCVISAINYGTNTITLSATKTWSNGAVVYCDSLAGSETARAVLNEFTALRDEDGTDRDKTFSKGIIFGQINPSLILGDIAAIRADTNARLNGIIWTDYVGKT